MRFVSEDNEIIGAINWFAVHPTSMNNTNHFVSSDNVGFAAILLEQQMNTKNLPGRVCGDRFHVLNFSKKEFFCLNIRENLSAHLHQRIWVMFHPILWVQSVSCPANVAMF